jgi:hypothetical protein
LRGFQGSACCLSTPPQKQMRASSVAPEASISRPEWHPVVVNTSTSFPLRGRMLPWCRRVDHADALTSKRRYRTGVEALSSGRYHALNEMDIGWIVEHETIG